MITAVVLSASNYGRSWPGIEVLLVHSVIKSAADLQRERFNAVQAVRTTHFFYLDDDDDLPPDYADVLDRCTDQRAALAYTDEIVNGELRKSAPYSQDAHLRDPLLVHHLALFDTAAARSAVQRLPRGHFCPELMLSWEVAKSGAAYIPEIGYHWNKRSTGMHRWPATVLSQMRAALWAKEHH